MGLYQETEQSSFMKLSMTEIRFSTPFPLRKGEGLGLEVILANAEAHLV